MWLTYLRLLPRAGVSVSVSVTESAVSGAYRKLADLENLETVWMTGRVTPLSIYDSHWLRSRRLRAVSEGLAPGVFQSTWDSSPGMESWPEVMMIHDLIPEMTLKPRSNVFHSQVIAARRTALRNADAVVAVSETTARDLRERYPETSSRLHVVRHGPTLSGVKASPIDETLQRYGVPFSPGAFYLFVGRREGYKNFALVRQLVDVAPGLALRGIVAVGGPPPASDELHPAIRFVPFVDDRGLAALYQSARALIYPSEYEGFGLPILEALTHGCAVASSNTDALVEVGGEASVYFDPDSVDDLIEALHEVDAMNRDDFLNRARANISRFSWESSAEKLLEIYRSVSPT